MPVVGGDAGRRLTAQAVRQADELEQLPEVGADLRDLQGPAEALGGQLEAEQVVDEAEVAPSRAVDRAEDDVVPLLLQDHHRPWTMRASCHAA